MNRLKSFFATSFFRFCVIGTIAFIIDAGILILATNFVGLSPITGRLMSFAAATAFTWVANRLYTFKVEKSGSIFHELLRYLSVNLLAFSINWAVYLLAIANFDIMYQFPSLATIPATACSMLFNYFGIKKYAFKVKD